MNPIIAESCFIQARAAYRCFELAREHARTLSGAERTECYAYAREEIQRVRRNGAHAAAQLGLVPPKGITLLELIGARGWRSRESGRASREIFTAAGVVVFIGNALRAWRWFHETEGHMRAECPMCQDGRNPDDGARICLNCHGSHFVAL